MKSTLVILTLIVLGAAGYNYWRSSNSQQAQSPAASVTPQASAAHPATSPSEAALYPVPDEAEPAGTNARRSSPGSEVDVDASNLSILKALSDLIGKERFESLFIWIILSAALSSRSMMQKNRNKPHKSFRLSVRWKQNFASPAKARRKSWVRATSAATSTTWI